MKKNVKKSARKSPKKSVPVPMGVPTVKQRLDIIDRAIVMIAAGLDVQSDEIGKQEPDLPRRPLSLHTGDVRLLVTLLSNAREQAAWLSMSLPADVLSAFAPTDDQRDSFEPLDVVAGGAR